MNGDALIRLDSGLQNYSGRRFPFAIIAQALSIRRLRASRSSTASIQVIKSLFPVAVRSLHRAFAVGVAFNAL